MPAARFVLALLLGYLAQEAIVVGTGIAAAVATPIGYFEFFGRQNRELALGLWLILSFAVPIFLLALLQAWLVLRFFRFRPALACVFLAGALLCWLRYMLEVPASDQMTTQLASPQQFWDLIRSIYFGDPWGLPSSWAPWLGLITGAYLASRSSKATPPLSAEA